MKSHEILRSNSSDSRYFFRIIANLAPSTQKQVPSYLWFKNPHDSHYNILKSRKDKAYSQDFVFHTLLSLLKIQTKDYDKSLDMVK